MANSFIIPGEITVLTFLSGQPIEGVGKFGPYRSYKVQTDDRQDQMFYAPKYLYDDLDSLGLTRGSVVKLLASPAETREGRRYTRLEIVGTGAPREIVAQSHTPTRREENADTRNGILASVALKAATQNRGLGADSKDVLATADTYLQWLRTA